MKLKINKLFTLLLSVIILIPTIQNIRASQRVSSEEILSKADQVRNPAESFSMKVDVLSGHEKEDHSSFEVSIQGNHKTLIKTLAPIRNRGRNMLMLDEEMWAFVPNLNRAVRISLAQKLSGQAANGDISRMRWSGDYDSTIESETPHEWTLLLTAKKKGLTYEKMRIWIEKTTFYPNKADFLTLSGTPLKSALYEDFQEIAGKIRPTTIRIQDAIRSQDISWIQIKEMKVKKFPASFFNQNALN